MTLKLDIARVHFIKERLMSEAADQSFPRSREQHRGDAHAHKTERDEQLPAADMSDREEHATRLLYLEFPIC